MHRSREYWLAYDAEDVRLDEVVLFDRLRVLSNRHFDSPLRDFGTLVASGPGAFMSEDDLDDFLAPLARYLRIPWDYLEEQTIARLARMHAAASRLITAENGKRPALDLNAASEENR